MTLHANQSFEFPSCFVGAFRYLGYLQNFHHGRFWASWGDRVNPLQLVLAKFRQINDTAYYTDLFQDISFHLLLNLYFLHLISDTGVRRIIGIRIE